MCNAKNYWQNNFTFISKAKNIPKIDMWSQNVVFTIKNFKLMNILYKERPPRFLFYITLKNTQFSNKWHLVCFFTIICRRNNRNCIVFYEQDSTSLEVRRKENCIVIKYVSKGINNKTDMKSFDYFLGGDWHKFIFCTVIILLYLSVLVDYNVK